MSLSHEKIYKLEDGSRLKVVAQLIVDSTRGTVEYGASVYAAAPGKRAFAPIVNRDTFSFRNMSMEERRQFTGKQLVAIAGEERLLEVKLELWESLKPTASTFH